MSSLHLSRRTVLRGLGATMALPLLECMLPGQGSRALASAFAAEPAASASAAAGALATPPVRTAFIFVPNGVNYDAWNPLAAATKAGHAAPASGVAPLHALSPTLEPLEGVRRHLNVFTGLTLDKARANGDGPGDHARSSASFLTGHQARKTAGNDIRIGISVDQLAARQIGSSTRLPSLELGCEQSPSSGNCDSGYSCAYTSNISWRAEDVPVPKLIDPADAFERLFGDPASAAARAQRLSRRQSILDFVRQDAARLNQRLGQADRHKLDQFHTSVREIERRIQAAADSGPARPPEGVKPPDGVPSGIRQHADLMFDLLLLAFQTDSTRVATLMLASDGSNRAFPEIGIKEGHHHLSHHQNNQAMIEAIRAIDRFYVERFARFVQRLAETPDGSGSLLDNAMILYGGGISDGNRHNHEDLPILLAGSAGGTLPTLPTGRLVVSPKETPLCNLYLSMLDRMNCRVDAFGDSTGRLAAL
ncbi:MAG: DUF1552 domain-containing protein [Phycisphaerales bacterium]|nr:DUF1552 domain-containing protein [Phycisphaerales bacterium]